ncbi:hypothetical protein DBR18_17440 [Pseudomonas sp. HMWF021]|nr:hypothetical protein DBR18_17440 [Pseudomonas sp. HMWF021]
MKRTSRWEQACSRKRWISQHFCRLTLRLREQARSYIWNAHPCGSEPARESGGSASILLTDTTPSRAGSLPHLKRTSRWEQACSHRF